MARDAVSVTDLTLNTGTDLVTGVDITPANGASIAAGGLTQRLLIHVVNAGASAYDVTIKAGSNPPAILASQGDVTFEVVASGESFFVIESARFAQSDGAIYVDFETGMTGKIAAYRLPKTA